MGGTLVHFVEKYIILWTVCGVIYYIVDSVWVILYCGQWFYLVFRLKNKKNENILILSVKLVKLS